jgi:hypothetical protein
MAEGRYNAMMKGYVYYPLDQMVRWAWVLAEGSHSKIIEEIEEDSAAVLSYAKSQEKQPHSMTDRNRDEGRERNRIGHRTKEKMKEGKGFTEREGKDTAHLQN